jgi:signal transduction histidine kinase
VVAAALLVVATGAVFLAARARRGQLSALREAARLEEEQARILKGLVLAEEAATRLLSPRELTKTVERIAAEAVELLGVEGVCVLVKPPAEQGDPIGISCGRIPPGMDDIERAVEQRHGEGFGPVLSMPIRLEDAWLGEFRIAESPEKTLTIREVQIARLLSQLIAIAAQHRSQQALIARAEEDKSRFIVATTHDLRAPLSTIQQLIGVMRDGYAGDLSPKGRELLEKIYGRSELLLDLLSDLLKLAFEEHAPGQMRTEKAVSLSAVFDSEIEAARIASEARGIRLESSRPESPLMRLAAEGDLENILGNLLSNAVKYTPAGGTITAQLEDSPGGIVFRVRDTGIGIPKDALPRLFTEYFRAPNAREKERHGTGLGLALVQKLVRKYGGRIRVDSKEGEGTVIEVLLPPNL